MNNELSRQIGENYESHSICKRRSFPTMGAAIVAALDDDFTENKVMRMYDDAGHCDVYSYRDLVREGLRWAQWYQDGGVARHQLVFIGLPMCLEYVGALIGAILMGIVPCTVPLGADKNHSKGALNNTYGAFREFSPKLFITSPETIQHCLTTLDIPSSVMTNAFAVTHESMLDTTLLPVIAPEDIHHLQLTSGSTSSPKAAALTHGCIVANIDAVSEAMSGDCGVDVGCCWLPMFHDMGLMQLLISIYQRAEMVLQSAGSFLRNPLSWLERISVHKASLAAAPPFAYSYCVRRYREDIANKLDLSSWRLAGVGGERVEHRVLREFSNYYSKHGFSAAAFVNCYGMAEAGFAVIMPEVPYSLDDTSAVPMVGKPVSGMQVEIRGTDGQILDDASEGELFLRGSSLMSGYYSKGGVVRDAVQDGWFATGDLVVRRENQIFVLGRKKEIIIIRGKNYYPQDFEYCVAAAPRVGLHRSVAIGIYKEQSGTESLVLLIEPQVLRNLDDLRAELQHRLRSHFGFGAEEIVFLKPGGIPKTTSHKAQRTQCRESYQNGRLDVVSTFLTTDNSARPELLSFNTTS